MEFTEEMEQEDETPAEPSGDDEEAKAAVVLQSNFRGHKERKRLQDEGKIPRKKTKEDLANPEASEPDILIEEFPPPPVELDQDQDQDLDYSPSGVDEEHAATVLQSNFRGHKERKRLRAERGGATGSEQEMSEEVEEQENEEGLDITDVQLEKKEEDTQDEEGQYDEQQAAIKIQSNFRGYKDRKNLKATSQKQDEEVESLFKEVLIFFYFS